MGARRKCARITHALQKLILVSKWRMAVVFLWCSFLLCAKVKISGPRCLVPSGVFRRLAEESPSRPLTPDPHRSHTSEKRPTAVPQDGVVLETQTGFRDDNGSRMRSGAARGRKVVSNRGSLNHRPSSESGHGVEDPLANVTTRNIHKLLGRKFSLSHDETFPFEYVIKEENFCSGKKYLYCLNFVFAAPHEVALRDRIRRMWGAEDPSRQTGLHVLFFLGRSSNVTLEAAVRRESDLHHDIILVDFIDSYRNLTFKTLSGLHWTRTFCPNVKWILKSDLDVFVNPFTLTKYLAMHDKYTNFKQDSFVCKKQLATQLQPCRPPCKVQKWEAPWNEYPFAVYPKHCQGPGYVIPRPLVDILYKVSDKRNPYRIEDVYYTGILPALLGNHIKMKNIEKQFPWRPQLWRKSFPYDLMILELDQVRENATDVLWDIVLKNRKKRKKDKTSK